MIDKEKNQRCKKRKEPKSDEEECEKIWASVAQEKFCE